MEVEKRIHFYFYILQCLVMAYPRAEAVSVMTCMLYGCVGDWRWSKKSEKMKIENRNREKQIAFGGYPCCVSHRLSLYVNVDVDFQYLVAPFCCLLYPFVYMVLLSIPNIHPHTLPSNDYVLLVAARLLALLLLSFLFSFHSRI